jgi:hypothetical protein
VYGGLPARGGLIVRLALDHRNSSGAAANPADTGFISMCRTIFPNSASLLQIHRAGSGVVQQAIHRHEDFAG